MDTAELVGKYYAQKRAGILPTVHFHIRNHLGEEAMFSTPEETAEVIEGLKPMEVEACACEGTECA